MVVYLDTSAAVKLVIAEPQSDALARWLVGRNPVSSDLLRTELLRATRRADPELLIRARRVLRTVELLTVQTALFERAGELAPDVLRSLDAIHLASALDLGDDLDAMVTYDERLAAAARHHGIAVVAPGATGRASP